jgi:hypothetical protein
MADDFVTGGEFSRWRSDFQAFQSRLDERLDSGFAGINDRLDRLNGRQRVSEEALARIQAGGCGQLAQHRELLQRSSEVAGLTAKNKAVLAGGAAGITGVVVAVVEVVKAWLK